MLATIVQHERSAYLDLDCHSDDRGLGRTGGSNGNRSSHVGELVCVCSKRGGEQVLGEGVDGDGSWKRREVLPAALN